MKCRARESTPKWKPEPGGLWRSITTSLPSTNAPERGNYRTSAGKTSMGSVLIGVAVAVHVQQREGPL